MGVTQAVFIHKTPRFLSHYWKNEIINIFWSFYCWGEFSIWCFGYHSIIISWSLTLSIERNFCKASILPWNASTKFSNLRDEKSTCNISCNVWAAIFQGIEYAFQILDGLYEFVFSMKRDCPDESTTGIHIMKNNENVSVQEL